MEAFLIDAIKKFGNHFGNGASGFITPHNFAKFTWLTSGNVNYYGIMHNTTVLAKCIIEVNTVCYVESKYEIDVEITI